MYHIVYLIIDICLTQVNIKHDTLFIIIAAIIVYGSVLRFPAATIVT